MYAVLIPYVKTESGDALLLEIRSQKVRQPGEVCFPGGRMEPGETALDTIMQMFTDMQIDSMRISC